jgi:hypothetical protein
MKLFLKTLFGSIFLVMLWINLKAALAMNILASFPLFGANPWAVATLYDAYCGVLTFYVWVAYRGEAGAFGKTPVASCSGRAPVHGRMGWACHQGWFNAPTVGLNAVMGLGNLAMSAYVLKELVKLRPDEPAWAMLQRRAA